MRSAGRWLLGAAALCALAGLLAPRVLRRLDPQLAAFGAYCTSAGADPWGRPFRLLWRFRSAGPIEPGVALDPRFTIARVLGPQGDATACEVSDARLRSVHVALVGPREPPGPGSEPYSWGPNGVDERLAGDDLSPCPAEWRDLAVPYGALVGRLRPGLLGVALLLALAAPGLRLARGPRGRGRDVAAVALAGAWLVAWPLGLAAWLATGMTPLAWWWAWLDQAAFVPDGVAAPRNVALCATALLVALGLATALRLRLRGAGEP